MTFLRKVLRTYYKKQMREADRVIFVGNLIDNMDGVEAYKNQQALVDALKPLNQAMIKAMDFAKGKIGKPTRDKDEAIRVLVRQLDLIASSLDSDAELMKEELDGVNFILNTGNRCQKKRSSNNTNPPSAPYNLIAKPTLKKSTIQIDFEQTPEDNVRMWSIEIKRTIDGPFENGRYTETTSTEITDILGVHKIWVRIVALGGSRGDSVPTEAVEVLLLND